MLAGWRGRGARQQGQALVEAALAMVPVLLVTVGLVQFSLYLYAWHVLNDSVADGARIASAQGRTVDEGVAYAQELLRAGLPGAGDMAVDGYAEADRVVLEGRGSLRLAIPLVTDTRVPLVARAAIHKEQFRPGGRAP